MKNVKSKLAVLTATVLFSLGFGNSVSAMQGIQKFNLKPAKEIIEQTRFSDTLYETNKRLRELCYEIEDKQKGGWERVFYGATTNEQLGLSVVIYKRHNKKIGEHNHAAIVYFKDACWWIPDKKSIKYVVYDGEEQNVNYQKFIERLEEITIPDFRQLGGARLYYFTIAGKTKLSEEEQKNINDSLYSGIRYKNQETGEMEDLVYVVKFRQDENNGISFEGYGNGNENLQDTDRDIL